MNRNRATLRSTAVLTLRLLRDLLREPRALLATLAVPLALYPLLFLLGGRLLERPAEAGAGWRLGLAAELAHLEPWLAGEGLWIVPPPQRPAEAVAEGLLDALLEPGPEGTGLRLLSAGSDAVRGRVEAALGQARQAALLERRAGILPEFLLAERAVVLEARPGPGLLAFLPLVLVLVLLSGSAFAALDFLPGERERGSLETLLAQPVGHRQILISVYMATLLCGLAALALNLLSLAALAPLCANRPGAPLPGWSGAGRLFLLCLPLALALTALLVWTMALARSFREGQAYLLPLTLGCLVPAGLGLSPALPLNGLTALLPLVGPLRIAREGLDGWPAVGPLLAMAAGALFWTALALWGAARHLASEHGRLGEDPLASLDAPQGPPGRRAVLWAIVLLFAYLVLAPPLQAALGPGGHAAAQVGLLLLPALALPRLVGVPLSRAFPLRRPTPGALAATLLVAAGAALVSLNLLALQQLLLPVPEALPWGLRRTLPGLERGGLLPLLLAAALLPGLCEESLFRGALLGAFRSHWGPGRALLLAALLFAAMHFSVYRFLPAFGAGLAFGALALAVRNLPLACLCHALHNGLVLSAAAGAWPAWAAGLLPRGEPGRALLLTGLGALAALLGLLLAAQGRGRGA